MSRRRSLEIGERLQTLSGDVKVVRQKLPRGPQPVFSLEVHNEHVYFVGHDGVMAHNSYQVDNVALGFRSLSRISENHSTPNVGILRMFKKLPSFASAKVGNALAGFRQGLRARGINTEILKGATDVNGMRSFIDGAKHVYFNLDGFSSARLSLWGAFQRGKKAALSGDVDGYTNV